MGNELLLELIKPPLSFQDDFFTEQPHWVWLHLIREKQQIWYLVQPFPKDIRVCFLQSSQFTDGETEVQASSLNKLTQAE